MPEWVPKTKILLFVDHYAACTQDVCYVKNVTVVPLPPPVATAFSSHWTWEHWGNSNITTASSLLGKQFTWLITFCIMMLHSWMQKYFCCTTFHCRIMVFYHTHDGGSEGATEPSMVKDNWDQLKSNISKNMHCVIVWWGWWWWCLGWVLRWWGGGGWGCVGSRT
jgi:hypothetical protein